MEGQLEFALPGGARTRAIYVLLGVTLIVFGMGIAGSFHWDDYSLFTDTAVTTPSGWTEVWQWIRSRPLTYLTFWANYQIGWQNPAGYLAVNLAMHLFGIWLLYGILHRLIGDPAAIIAAALFALHPMQAEPVLYVFERATLLSTIFCLLCWRSWLNRRYWPAVGWFALALLAKEECVAFPLFLLFFERAIRPVAAMLGLSLAAGIRVIASLAALHVAATAPVATAAAGAAAKGAAPYAATLSAVIFSYFRASLLPYLCTQGLVLLRYFRMLIFPYGFSVDPDIPLVLDWRGWAAWAAILGVAIVLWKRTAHGKWFAAGLLLLLPSSSIFPAADMAADRRLYLPMVALGAFAGLLLKGPRLRLAAIPLLLALAAVSSTRTGVWRTESALWSEAVERGPRKVRPMLQLSRASEPEVALRILDGAERVAPTDYRPLVEKGLRLLALNRPDQALPEFERALILLPNDPEILNDRGVALTFLGRPDEAAEDFRRVLGMNPCMAAARRNLGRLGMTYPNTCP